MTVTSIFGTPEDSDRAVPRFASRQDGDLRRIPPPADDRCAERGTILQASSRSVRQPSSREIKMGNRAKRRAWEISVRNDPRMTEPERRAALAIGEKHKKGFLLCEIDDDYYFVKNEQWRMACAA
jgi:hypothetical protein